MPQTIENRKEARAAAEDMAPMSATFAFKDRAIKVTSSPGEPIAMKRGIRERCQ
jgi:hypothetical protein